MLGERAARGAGQLFLGNTLSQIVQGVGIILVARLLGATDYGLYTLLLVPAATFFVFTRIGFGTAATRYVAYYNAQGRRDLADSFAASTFLYAAAIYALITLAAAVAAPAFASEILHEPAIGGLARLACATIFFQSVMNHAIDTLSGYYKMKQVSAVLLVQAVSKTVLSVGLIVAGLRVLGALLGAILSFAVAGAVGTLWLFSTVKVKGVLFDRKTFERALSFGLPLYLASMVNGLSTQLQLVILASFASAAAIGAFTAAQNLAALVGILAYPLSAMAGVAFSEVSARNDEKRTASAYANATKMAAVLVVPASFFLILAGKPMVGVLYGSAYLGYYLLLPVLAAGYLSVGLGGQTQVPLFNSLGNTKVNLYIAVVWSTLLLSLSLGLGFWLGVFGVALATSIASAATAAIVHLRFVRGLGITLSGRRVGAVYVAALLAAAPMIPLAQRVLHHGLIGLSELLLLLALYSLAYSTLLPLIRGVNRGELKLVSQSMSGIPILGEILLGLTRYAELFVLEEKKCGGGRSSNS